MIGKPEWFTYRIFGWGIAAKTWQGWVYIGALVALLLACIAIPMPYQLYAIGTIVAITIIDTMHIMMQLPKAHDERENYHQLLIERNCSFAAIFGLVIVAALDSAKLLPQSMTITYSLAAVLGVMLLTKIASTAYVKYKL